jgi:hypothetical protein
MGKRISCYEIKFSLEKREKDIAHSLYLNMIFVFAQKPQIITCNQLYFSYPNNDWNHL